MGCGCKPQVRKHFPMAGTYVCMHACMDVFMYVCIICYVVLCYVMLCKVIQCNDMLCNAMKCNVMKCDVMECNVL